MSLLRKYFSKSSSIATECVSSDGEGVAENTQPGKSFTIHFDVAHQN